MHPDHDCLRHTACCWRDDQQCWRIPVETAHLRRGSTSAGVATVCALLGSLLVFAFVFSPVALQAGRSSNGNTIPAATRGHQQVIEQIAALIARSHAVIAIHDQRDTPFTEVVLWLEDAEGDGAVHARDVAIISHSPLLQTINVYLAEPGPGEPPEPPSGLEPGWWAVAPLREVDFCDRWRTSPDVRPRLLATGISDMELQWLTPTSGGAADTVDHLDGAGSDQPSDRLQLALTWAADSTDGADKASVVIATR